MGGLDATRGEETTRAVILAYHRILPAEQLRAFPYLEDLATPLELFEAHLDLLARRFRVLPLPELVARLAEGKSLPAGAVALTFDDGYADNYDYAWPALSRHELPATFFLTTSYLDNQSGLAWWDEVSRWRHLGKQEVEVEGLGRRRLVSREDRDRLLGDLKRFPVDEVVERVRRASQKMGLQPTRDPLTSFLTWDQVREMQGELMSFGSHTVSHCLLPVETPERRRQELARSRTVLEEKLGAPCTLFCYPSGASTEEVAGEVEACGYQAAVEARPADVRSGANLHPFRLPRKTVNYRVSRTTLRFKLSSRSEKIKGWLGAGRGGNS